MDVNCTSGIVALHQRLGEEGASIRGRIATEREGDSDCKDDAGQSHSYEADKVTCSMRVVMS